MNNVDRSSRLIKMHILWAWSTQTYNHIDSQIDRWIGDLLIKPLFIHGLYLMAYQLTFAVLVLELCKSKLPSLTVKMATGWKKRRGGIVPLPCDFHPPVFLKMTGPSVFLLTHQYFRALHMECSSDFEYKACTQTSSLFLSDMTTSNAQWKLKNQCTAPLTPYLMKFVKALLGDAGSFIKSRGGNIEEI